MAGKAITFGVIVGNRGFFPDSLAKQGRKDILDVIKAAGHKAVALKTTDTKHGTVETFDDAKKCAALFAENNKAIDGIIITLPNFGDEKGVAETIKRSGLCVPILVHAEPDTPAKMSLADRRDSFCGKMSVCNNLKQAEIPYTLTQSHTVKVKSAQFKQELDDFATVCRIIKGLHHARFGAIGARTTAFNTVRYSEKLLELSGIAIETIDLSEIIGRANKLAENDKALTNKLRAIKRYVPIQKVVTPESLLRMARLAVVLEQHAKDLELDGIALQCWTSIEEFYGIAPCTVMSMMGEAGLPNACEVDVTGLLAMHILQLASGQPSALMDWNNNYGDSEDKCVLFHCGNFPKSFVEKPLMGPHDILGDTVGAGNSCGAITGRVKPGNATFCRTSTDDAGGSIIAYVGEGTFTKDKLDSFGACGVMKIPNLQLLLQYICNMGFEHHVAISMCEKADPIVEALDNYLGWDVYRHF